MPAIQFRSPRLGTRIALTMLGAILALQALNSLVFFLLPRPDFKIYSARWLVAETSKVASALASAPPSSEQAIAERFNIETGLSLRRRPGQPFGERRRDFPALQRLDDSLVAALAGKVKNIAVNWGPPGPARESEPVMVPPEFELSLPRGALSPTEPDLPIWGRFEIAFTTFDGRDYEISTGRRPLFGWFLSPPVLSLAGAVILITFLSAWIAKRTLRPLEDLSAAARRLGTEREPTQIDTKQLRDFAAIGDVLNEMQVRIKDFIGERTQILAAISHDLRTALTRLRLDAESLPDGTAKQHLVSGIEEMEGMISATLTFAGDDLKGEKSQSLDLAALLITICDTFADTGAAVHYQGPDHLQATCQPTAIRRAFTNLVDNALKYGQEARITLASERDAVVIAVADRGPGIPQDLVPLAFKPFRRLEQSRNRETGGVGLGLTIARDIVRAHGGTLTLANADTGGLVATVRLPATPGAA